MEKRAVIYIRVSDPSQIDNNSLETQVKSCTSFANTNQYEIVRIFRDEGKSAKHVYTRPALRELLAFCTTKKNQINAVIVYKFDRFSRDTSEGLAAISLLGKSDVEVVSATEISEMNPMGKAIRTVLMAFGQLDNENKGQRVRDNMQEVFRNGLWPFKCPIGYKRKYRTKEENKGIPPIIDPNLYPIIKDMFEKASTGIYSKAQLARMMNLAGFGDFYRIKADHKIVHNILKKTFYYGYMYARKWDEYAWGKHERIIDKPTWEKSYQKVIMKKKNHSYQDTDLYPLKGTLKCDLCGEIMTTCPSKGRNRKVYYYECKNKACRKVRIDSVLAHKQFVTILTKIQPSPRVIKLFTYMVFSEWDKVINQTKEATRKINDRISGLKAELKSIRKSKDEGIYTIEEAKEQASDLRQELTVLEIERSDVKIEQYNAEIVKEFTERFLMNLYKLWKVLDLAKKQELQRKIFVGGLICQKNKEIRTAELSPSFVLIRTLTTEKDKNVTPLGLEPKLEG